MLKMLSAFVFLAAPLDRLMPFGQVGISGRSEQAGIVAASVSDLAASSGENDTGELLMPEHLKEVRDMPRLPLEGSLDLTYLCNNNCRHCWLRIPAGSPERQRELTLDEIKGIVDEARKMGCRHRSISGGEPMLRPDFAEIFDYITRKLVSYSLNTNGMLTTPGIARLMTRRGNKMVALYGATAEVHDHVTRHPGSFEATMRGFACLVDTCYLIPRSIVVDRGRSNVDDAVH
jgi:sulfatase maturation enzyme AslB (radical SAM superfamily)